LSNKIDIRDLQAGTVIKQIGNPESNLLWAKERAAAVDGRMPLTPCPHPMSAIEQFVDEEHGREGRPTNLFACGVCKRLLRLIDAHGKEALDG
jgi:hypothetical protein